MEHIHPVIDDDPHFSIDTGTRYITYTGEDKLVLIQGDHNSEQFSFKMPRIVDGHDMMLCNLVQVHYVNVNGEIPDVQSADVYTVDDLAVSEDDEDTITWSWLISQTATTHVGTLNFALRFACVEDSKITYVWNTAPYSGVIISNGISSAETIVVQYGDVLDKWYEEFMNAGATGVRMIDEAIPEAIEKVTEESIKIVTAHKLTAADILVQEKGQSEERIMSQNSVSQELDGLENIIEIKTLAAVNDARKVCDEYVDKFESLMPLIADELRYNPDREIYYILELGRRYHITEVNYPARVMVNYSMPFCVYKGLDQVTYENDLDLEYDLFESDTFTVDKDWFEFKLLKVTEVTGGISVTYLVDGNQYEFTKSSSDMKSDIARILKEDGTYELADDEGIVLQYSDADFSNSIAIVYGCDSVAHYAHEIPYKVTANNIADIRKTATNGLTDTYTISFDDGSTKTFDVKNGNGIDDVVLTDRGDYEDTYTIYLANGSTETFKVPNGGSVGVKKNVSGEIISVSDVSPLKHRVKVKARSKNLIPYPYSDTTKTVNGITYTDNGDGSITANGTATANAAFYFTNAGTGFYVDGTVCLSGCPEGGSASGTGYSLRLNYYEDGAETSGMVDVGNGKSITLDDKLSIVYFVVLAGGTVNDLVIKPQLELGDTATDYVPYIDPADTNCYVCGKNLLDASELGSSNTNAGVTVTRVDDVFTFNGTATNSVTLLDNVLYIAGGKGNKYTLSCVHVGGTMSGQVTACLGERDNSDTKRSSWIGLKLPDAESITLALSKNYINDFWFYVESGATFDNYQIKLQFELGDTATEYVDVRHTEYGFNPDGSVSGVNSVSPNMTVYTDTPGIILDVEYNVLADKELELKLESNVEVVNPNTLTVDKFHELSKKFLAGKISILLNLGGGTFATVNEVEHCEPDEGYSRWAASYIANYASDDVAPNPVIKFVEVQYNPNSGIIVQRETRELSGGIDNGQVTELIVKNSGYDHIVTVTNTEEFIAAMDLTGRVRVVMPTNSNWFNPDESLSLSVQASLIEFSGVLSFDTTVEVELSSADFGQLRGLRVDQGGTHSSLIIDAFGAVEDVRIVTLTNELSIDRSMISYTNCVNISNCDFSGLSYCCNVVNCVFKILTDDPIELIYHCDNLNGISTDSVVDCSKYEQVIYACDGISNVSKKVGGIDPTTCTNVDPDTCPGWKGSKGDYYDHLVKIEFWPDLKKLEGLTGKVRVDCAESDIILDTDLTINLGPAVYEFIGVLFLNSFDGEDLTFYGDRTKTVIKDLRVEFDPDAGVQTLRIDECSKVEGIRIVDPENIGCCSVHLTNIDWVTECDFVTVGESVYVINCNMVRTDDYGTDDYRINACTIVSGIYVVGSDNNVGEEAVISCDYVSNIDPTILVSDNCLYVDPDTCPGWQGERPSGGKLYFHHVMASIYSTEMDDTAISMEVPVYRRTNEPITSIDDLVEGEIVSLARYTYICPTEYDSGNSIYVSSYINPPPNENFKATLYISYYDIDNDTMKTVTYRISELEIVSDTVMEV